MTVSIELHPRIRVDGTQLMQVAVQNGKERKRISTEIYVKKAFFRPKAKWGKWIRETHPDAAGLNLDLEKQINKHRGRTSPDGKDSFFVFAEEFIEQYNNRDQDGTYQTYLAKLVKLKGFSSPHLTFRQIDHAFLRQYITHLKKKKENTVNTISVDLKKIRAIINQAVREKKVAHADNPFLDFKIETTRTSKQKLEGSELDIIRGLNLSESQWLTDARNIFLFCLNCMGMRIGAALKLRPHQISNGKLFYQADKGGKSKNIDLPTEAAQIISLYMKGKYAFPYLDDTKGEYRDIKRKTALINKALKKIASLAGIDKTLSSHVARHTLTKLALDSKVDMRVLQGMLGHSTIAVTEHYAGEISDVGGNEALKKIFSKE